MIQRLHDTIRRLEQERDALAAQVAALVERFDAPGHDMETAGLLAYAEAFSAKYLAAQRLAEFFDRSNGDDDAVATLGRLIDERRKAGEA